MQRCLPDTPSEDLEPEPEADGDGARDGGGDDGCISSVSNTWLSGSEGNAGRVPESVKRALAGNSYTDFATLRSDFWKAVAADVSLASQFSTQNQSLMRNGNAPKVVQNQQYGGRTTYELHHITPKSRGGAEFDLSNLVVVTPLFHSQILDSCYHFGGGAK